MEPPARREKTEKAVPSGRIAQRKVEAGAPVAVPVEKEQNYQQITAAVVEVARAAIKLTAPTEVAAAEAALDPGQAQMEAETAGAEEHLEIPPRHLETAPERGEAVALRNSLAPTEGSVPASLLSPGATPHLIQPGKTPRTSKNETIAQILKKYGITGE